MSLSVVIITKNEAQNIGPCIESVSFADEIIVLDGKSEDQTASIARGLGARVIEVDEFRGFGAQKNWALSFASSEWVLSLDADERVPSELAREIQLVLKNEASSSRTTQTRNHIGFDIPRLTQFCGQWIHHCGWQPDRVIRLFKRSDAVFSDDLVHEKLLPTGGGEWSKLNLGHLNCNLEHYSYRTPDDYWRKLEHYSRAWALERHARGVKVSMLRALFSSAFAFLRSYVFRLGFLDGSMGLAVCMMQAQATFAKYFTLYCLHQNQD
jgi:glycosyltransferase involved in cell wall biosynthesis